MSNQFSNPIGIANSTTNGFIKPDGVTAIMDSNGLITKVIDISPTQFVGRVTIGDVGAGTTGSIPVTSSLASATKTNPDPTNSVIVINFINPMPDLNYLIALANAGSNSHTVVFTVTNKTVNGFTVNLRQVISVVQTMTLNVAISTYTP